MTQFWNSTIAPKTKRRHCEERALKTIKSTTRTECVLPFTTNSGNHHRPLLWLKLMTTTFHFSFLSALRDALLPKLLSGAVRVSTRPETEAKTNRFV